MKISLKSVFGVLMVILTITAILILIPAKEDNTKENNSEINYEKLNDIVFNVKAKEVTTGNLIQSISANGLIKAYRELDIVSNITNYIDKIFVSEGKFVNKDDLLIKFDDREYQIAISEAEVNLMNAKIEYGFYTKEVAQNIDANLADSVKVKLEKLEVMFKENKINKEEYLNTKEKLDLALLFSGAKRDEVLLNKSGMTNAINSSNRAKLNLSYTEITAPFNGVVADFSLVPKQRITSGEKLFKLLDISRLKVDVGILENEINKVHIGNNAIVRLTALPDKIYYGKVIYINPIIDPEIKTCRVTVEITNSDINIKPGMFASVKIETDILKNRVIIPKEALLVRDKRDLVFVVQNNLAKWQYVNIGQQNDEYIEILNGVSPGDSVIVEGHFNLAHDSNIKSVNK
ncbi:MAG: efflux RND transporter periplasmic adaptor subunit [Ignavibacterium sp.]|jgi:HlyD family secretion protein|nr:efflux RND transporter periplasmic adaptor subunit [Ignavibacterium sp.]MDX9713708.1 efflux RND transporter periplasmic adaptor subunit [Ignavibacteriaceae bacterium]